MAKGSREQTRNSESVVNTRQDRNTFITDGGTWSWDAGTGTLSWNGTINIRRGGAVVHTIAAGSVVGLSTAGNVAFVDVDRTSGGALTLEGGTSPGPATDLDDSGNSTDERLVVAIRGSDNKLYMRTTVFADGDSKTLGTLNAATDRADQAATGAATETVPFSYVVGSNQLAVYVGGILMEETLHYTEASTTTITWTTLGQPAAGERLTFLNVIGGEGPAGGTGSVQTAYDNGRTFQTGGGTLPLQGWNGTSVNQPIFAAGTGATLPDVTAYLSNDGFLVSSSGVAGFRISENPVGTGKAWEGVPLDDASGDFILFNTNTGKGIRIDKATGGIEHGAYTTGFLAYPGGAWSADGVGGGLRWAVYTGSIDIAGADEVIATGLSGIIGVMCSVEDGNSGNINAMGMADAHFSTKRITAFFDDSTGDVTLAGNLSQSQLIGSHLWGEAYTLIVFYQG